MYVLFCCSTLSPIHSNALEELSIRASIALNQKRVFHDLVTNGAEDEDFENEYHALSAQVVSSGSKFVHFAAGL